MDKIISLPSNIVGNFNLLTGLNPIEWFATSDPEGMKVGSGGGTAWALYRHAQSRHVDFQQYLSAEKHIVVHGGGQSRRLPAYAPSGKVLTPVPILRWSRGESIEQTLLSMQMPLYERIMQRSGAQQNTLVASGDVFIYAPTLPSDIPEADVVCFGLWTSPHAASHHGVFFAPREAPERLDFMLQKPSHAEIESLSATHLFLMDIGVWVLSNRAVELLMRKCGWNGTTFRGGVPTFYDLYSTFGTALGLHPSAQDDDIEQLSVALVTLHDGEFYHFGTSGEMITSTERLQNRVVDGRSIWQKKIKPQSSIFTQNTNCRFAFTPGNNNIWVENSTIGERWMLTSGNIVTGVPDNDWSLTLEPGKCLDIIPIGERDYCIRVYGIDDKFSGECDNPSTTFMNKPFIEWLTERGMSFAKSGIDASCDIQRAPIFPVVGSEELTQQFIEWLLRGGDRTYTDKWLSLTRLSAEDISRRANLVRLFAQRKHHLKEALPVMARNYAKSVFYQIDLEQCAKLYIREALPLPPTIADDASAVVRMRDSMFRARVIRDADESMRYERQAFSILHDTIRSTITDKADPHCQVFVDQIVWGRSPARLDLAGGWTDTPPHCMQDGGSVINIAVELNGQPPIQVFIRVVPNRYNIVLRSIDNGVAETIATFEELASYNAVGSAFSIPKAALCLSGFHPEFCLRKYQSLQEQLRSFGGGIEITQLVAIPKGSGLGTSSILAATLLGALSDFAGLRWTLKQICHRTLVLEQLLTTGGGWQDQYGGIFAGLKMLTSKPGTQADIEVKWLPEQLFRQPEFSNCWLLYYTGITRVAKNILSEIVRGMFLNEQRRLAILTDMKQHVEHMADAIQTSDFALTGELLRRSWELNLKLDQGTSTPEIEKIIQPIDHLSAGYKLLGAGGGGYLLICAKDQYSAIQIRSILLQNPPNDRARFVEMAISNTGLQISRS